MKKSIYILPMILIMGLFLVRSAQADIKATAVLNGYDYASGTYKNGAIAGWLDDVGRWQSFYHELNYDNGAWADACGSGTSTKWAGNFIVGLFHTDTGGEPGYQETRNWQLVRAEPTANLSPTPDISGSELTVLSQDVVDGNDCGGNCQNEIISTIFVNTDTNCDGVQNTNETLYIYFEARLPFLSDTPRWQGNIQVRLNDTTGGGEKTVNTAIFGPNAIETTSFTGDAFINPAQLAVVFAVLLLLIGLTAVSIVKRKS